MSARDDGNATGCAGRTSALVRTSILGFGALCATTALTDGVPADPPSNCTGSNGIYICTGNQSNGFTFPIALNGTLIKPVTVEDLSGDISGRFFLNSQATASEGPINLRVGLGSRTQTLASGGPSNQSFLLYSRPTDASDSAARVNGAFTRTATNSASRQVIQQAAEGVAGDDGTSPQTRTVDQAERAVTAARTLWY